MLTDEQISVLESARAQDDTIIIGGETVDLNISSQGAACSVIDLGSSNTIDTITLDNSVYTFPTITLPSVGSTCYTNGSTYTTSYNITGISSIGTTPTVNLDNDGISVKEEGDIKLGGRSLKDFMTKMEERLAILVPDPKKLEKFEALKKAYEHYKTMERLCQIEDDEDKNK